MEIVPAAHSFRGFKKMIQLADIERDLTEHQKDILRHQRCPRKPDRYRLKRGERRIKRLRRPDDHQALTPGDPVALDSITEYVPVDRGCEKKIIHYFTHPRTPKQNAVAERFNQTVQDECLYLTDLERPREELNEILRAWLHLGRPHETPGYRPPAVQYFHLITRPVRRREVLPRLWSSTPI